MSPEQALVEMGLSSAKNAAKTAAMFSGIVAIAESVYKEDDISGCIGNVVKSSAGAAVSGGAAAISAEAAGVLAFMFGAGPVVMAAASLSVGFVAGTLVSEITSDFFDEVGNHVENATFKATNAIGDACLAVDCFVSAIGCEIQSVFDCFRFF
jgi:hypothetical protein